MKKLLLAGLATSLIGCAACAGEAKVTWQEPDQYTDICEGTELRDHFRAKLFQDFESIFSDLAKQLPDGYLFEVTVTDLDLAGQINDMHDARWQDVRVIRDIYWPRMSINYTLKNSARETLAAGQEEIKDMDFLSSTSSFGMTRFGYEERMLRHWFKKQQRDGKFPLKTS